MTHDKRSPKYQYLRLFVLVPKNVYIYIYIYIRKIYDMKYFVILRKWVKFFLKYFQRVFQVFRINNY